MPLQFRNGLSTNRTSVTPAQGEPLWDTDTKRLYVGDGTTAGGNPVGGSGTGAVSQIVAGAGINVSPAGGTGTVTVSATGAGVSAYRVKRYARFASKAAALQAGAPQTTNGLNANWQRSPDVFGVNNPYTHTSYQVLGAYTAGAGYAATLTLAGTSGGSFAGGVTEQYTDSILNNGHTAGTFNAASLTYTVSGVSGNAAIPDRIWIDTATNGANLTIAISYNSTASGNIGLTTNGTDYTFPSYPNPLGVRLLCCIWDTANSRFIIGGETGLLLTSPDGVTWTQVTNSLNTNMNSIAVNTAGTIYAINGGAHWSNSLTTSVTWTAAVGAPGISLAYISFANNAFFVTGSNGATTCYLYRSSDPSVSNNWTQVATANVFSSNVGHATKVVFNTPTYAVAYSAFAAGSATSILIFSSTNGLGWTQTTQGSVYSSGIGIVVFNNSIYTINYNASAGSLAAINIATLNNVATNLPTTGYTRSTTLSQFPIAIAVTNNATRATILGNITGQASYTSNAIATWSPVNFSANTINCTIPYPTNASGGTATATFVITVGGNLSTATTPSITSDIATRISSNAPTIVGPGGGNVPAFTATALSATQFQIAYAYTAAVATPTFLVTQSTGGTVSTTALAASATSGATASSITFSNVQQATNRAQYQISGAPTISGTLYTYPVTVLTNTGTLFSTMVFDTQQTLNGAVNEFTGFTGTIASGTTVVFRSGSTTLSAGSLLSTVTSIQIDTAGFGATVQTALQALTTNNYIFVQNPSTVSTTATVILTSGGNYLSIANDIAQFFNTTEVAYTATTAGGVVTITGSAPGNLPDITQVISAGTNGTIVTSDFTLAKVRDGSANVATGSPSIVTLTKAANYGTGTVNLSLAIGDSATSAASFSTLITGLQGLGYYAYQSGPATITLQDADPTSGGVLTTLVNNGASPVGTVTAVVTQTSAGVAEVINASTTGWSAPINEGTQVT